MKQLLSRLKIQYRGVWVPMLMNIAGMTVAIVAAIAMFSQVWFDVTYDTFHHNADRLYKMHMIYPTATIDSIGRTNTLSMQVVKQMCDSVSGIKRVSYSLLDSEYKTWHGETGDFSHPYFTIDSSFVKMFDFDLVAGDLNLFLNDENAVLIPESLAHLKWGCVDIVGGVISKEPDTIKIAGIYRDFPQNSLLKNNLYRFLDITHRKKENSWVYDVFVELDEKADVAEVKQRLDKCFDAIKQTMAENTPLSIENYTIELMPIHELHYVTELVEANDSKVSKDGVFLLVGISVIILLIAGFNFANFSISRVPRRIKNVNIRRILGASRSRLVFSILSESVFLVVFSWFLAVVIVIVFADEWMFGVSSNRLYLTEIFPIFFYALAIAVFLGLLVGVYPAVKLLRLRPQTAFKHHSGLSRSSRILQDVLLTVQMFCSFALVSFTYTMLLQEHYLKSGGNIDKEHLLFAYMKDTIPDAEPLYEKLNSIPGVSGSALSMRILTTQDQYSLWRGNDDVEVTVLPVSYNYLDVMGIGIAEGRNFQKNDNNVVIMNETARKQYLDKVAVGKRFFITEDFEGLEIVGICEDVNFKSLRYEIEPVAFLLLGGNHLTCVNVRLNNETDVEEVKNMLISSLDTIDVNYRHTFRTLDEIYTSTYRYEILTTNRISLFALVAIFISLMGLCAMVIVNGEYGVKTIAVKYVNGASVGQLLIEQLKHYVVMMVIAGVCSCVLYYLFMEDVWLSRFNYRVELSWWHCLAPMMVMMIGILLLASALVIRYIRIQPASVLKYE